MEKPFCCPLCCARIRTNVGLKIHIKKVHSGSLSNKGGFARLSVVSDRAMVRGTCAPSVCTLCGFCCTSREVLTLHEESIHLSSRRSSAPKRGGRGQVLAQGKTGDLRTFASAVESRAKDSITSDLPPLCCTDEFGKPRAVYVPVHLTRAESELLQQLSHDPEEASSSKNQSREVSHRSNVADRTPPAVTSGQESQRRSFLSLKQDPVDIDILNEIFEVVCNESQLPDSPKPESRTFAVSEEMLQALNLASDTAEVFEFTGDFGALIGRELYLHDAGDFVEIHVMEADGSTTVMKALRRMDAKLEFVPRAGQDAELQPSTAC